MMKFLLDKIKKVLPDLNGAMNLGIVKYLSEQLDIDLKKLAANDRYFMDTAEGFIDYYSPHFEDQQKNKQALLEKYLEVLALIEATIMLIEQKKKEEAELLLAEVTPENKKKIREVRKSISGLICIKDPALLLARNDIKKTILKIKEIDKDRKELRKLVKELKDDDNSGCGLFKLSESKKSISKEELRLFLNNKPAFALFGTKVFFIYKDGSKTRLTENASPELMRIFPTNYDECEAATSEQIRKIELCVIDYKSPVIIKMSDDERMIKEGLKLQLEIKMQGVSKAKGVEKAEKKRSSLEVQLAIHMKLQAKIPHGLMDIKRVLYILQNKIKINEEIPILELKLKKEGLTGDERGKLTQELTELQKSFEFFKLSDIFSDEKEIEDMFSDLRGLMKTSIKDFQEIVVHGGDFNALLHKSTGFYWENLSLYRQTLLAIDKYLKDKTSLTTQGKVVAESVCEAIRKLPTEREIIDALQKITKVDEDFSKCKEIYDPKKEPFVGFFSKLPMFTELMEYFKQKGGDFFYVPYNAHLYVLDHPSHTDLADALGNCHGEAMMFLQRINEKKPTINNICPESDLINFQLNQLKKISSSKEVKSLGYGVVPPDVRGVTWDDIKATVQKEVKSEHGDLCLLKLDGGEKEGRSDEIGHRIALIKLKSPPAKYKYVVYDYNLGAMGLSDDLQLQEYFNKVLSYFLPFKKFDLEKHGEVNTNCLEFIDSIRPTSNASLDTVCKRDYWNKQRLMLLAKYGDNNPQNGLRKVLENTGMLSPADRISIYEAVLENKNVSLGELLTWSIESNNLEFIEKLLVQDSIKDFEYLETNFANEEKIAQLVSDGKVPADVAPQVFNKNKAIILAAYRKDSSTIKFADESIVVSLVKSKDVKLSDAIVGNEKTMLYKLIQLSIKKFDIELMIEILNNRSFLSDDIKYSNTGIYNIERDIIFLLDNGKIDAQLACSVFRTNIEIVNAAFKKNSDNLKYVDLKMVRELLRIGYIKARDVYNVFGNDIEFVKVAYEMDYDLSKSSIKFVDSSLVKELAKDRRYLNQDRVNFCKAFSTNKDVVLTLYQVAPPDQDILQYADKSLIIALIASGDLKKSAKIMDESDLKSVCHLFNKDENVVLAAFSKSHDQEGLLQIINKDLRKRLITEGKIPLDVAAKAFPKDENFKLGIKIQKQLESLCSLNKAGSNLISNIKELNSIFISIGKIPFDKILQSIDEIGRDLCKQLILKKPSLDIAAQEKLSVDQDSLPRLSGEDLLAKLMQLADIKNGLILAQYREANIGLGKTVVPVTSASAAEQAIQNKAVNERKLLEGNIEQQRLLFIKYLDELKIKTKVLISKKNEGNKKYYKVGMVAETLNFVLDAASKKFFATPTRLEFKIFKDSCEGAIRNVEKEFKQHRSMVGKIWKGIRTILKGIIGVIALLAVIPYFAMERKSKHSFRNTFFANSKTDSSEKLATFEKGAKTVIDELEKNYPPKS